MGAAALQKVLKAVWDLPFVAEAGATYGLKSWEDVEPVCELIDVEILTAILDASLKATTPKTAAAANSATANFEVLRDILYTKLKESAPKATTAMTAAETETPALKALKALSKAVAIVKLKTVVHPNAKLVEKEKVVDPKEKLLQPLELNWNEHFLPVFEDINNVEDLQDKVRDSTEVLQALLKTKDPKAFLRLLASKLALK